MWSRFRHLRNDDPGSAVVDFVLVGMLLVGLTLGILQLALFLHVRNTLHDAAIEGAHRAALVGESSVTGEALARALIRTSLGSDFAAQVRSRSAVSGGQRFATIDITTTLPVVGMWGPARSLTVSGRAPLEFLGGLR